MYYYRIYGEKVESDIDFPQLVSDSTDSKPTIRIMRRKTSDEILKQMESSYTVTGEKESWFYNSTLRCVITNSENIYYEPFENINEQYLRTYILGYGLSMLFLQKGRLAFHGSCIRNDDKALIISGVSGAGKSTLTSKFLSSDYEFMADDITVVDCNDKEVSAYPGFPYQKLCRDVVEKKQLDKDDLIYIDEDKDKYLAKWDGTYSTDGAKLTTLVVILVGDKDSKLTIEKANGVEKLQYVLNNLFLKKRILFQDSNPKLIQLCLDVASKIDIIVVSRPYGADSVDEQFRLIEDAIIK